MNFGVVVPRLGSSPLNQPPIPFIPYPTTVNPANTLHIYTHNTSGTKNKIFNMNHKLANCDYDIIRLQETWWNDSVQSVELTRGTPYEGFRFDRSQSSNQAQTGGAALILAHKKLSPTRATINIDNPFVEFIAITIHPTLTVDILVATVYVFGYQQRLAYSQLQHILSDLTTTRKFSHIILCGDFNLSILAWTPDHDVPDIMQPLPTSGDHPVTDDWLAESAALNLHQAI